jgi:hypothetical protein
MKDLNSIFKPLVKSIIKYNVTIFFVIIAVLMGLSIYNLNESMKTASVVPEPTTSSQQGLVNFSQYNEVVTLVEGLRTSSEMPEASVPSGRINPFAE